MKKLCESIAIIIMIGLLSGCAVPLVTAARTGNYQEVKALLDSGADINTREGGSTPLTLAIWYRHSSMAKLLIERGADVNQASAIIHGLDTPLIIAAARGNSEIINLLIDKGADLEHALSICQQKSNVMLVGHHYQNCQATLRSVKIKQEAARSQNISKNDLSRMVQSAVEKASKDREKDTKPSSVKSDISTPSFDISDNIISDNDLAAIIGIETYQSLPKSDYSYDDAKLVKDYIKALGFRERNIELLTNERATHSGIVKVIDAWLRNKAKPGSKVFVYYSGHGAPDPSTGESYIVPYDGDPNYLQETGYPLKRLYDRLGSLPAGEVFVVLDACFSGSGGRSVLAKGARPLVMSAASVKMPPNIALLTATQGTQISTSSLDKGHGIFTYYFLKALKDGKKNVVEIYDYVKPQVEDDAKAINVQQSPNLYPSPEKLVGRFNLRR